MDPPGKPRLCALVRGPDGYGFNLHGEKGQHGQYIRAVDDGSPAQLAGLRSGDRVIEVDGTNIERETHTQVVARIKAGGGSTNLLVVDKELDAYCRKNGITIKASMAESGPEETPRINGDHLEVESEVHMNGDAEGMGNHDIIEATVETPVESAPERQEVEEEHQYSEINRREEQELEDEEEAVGEQFASALADVEIEDEERKEVIEDAVVTAQEVDMQESTPAPPVDRDEDPDVNIPEPEPEPLLEAANVPDVESAPPVENTETDGPGDIGEPEPVREPTPEPVREPTPEPVREPTPEPVREPTPEPEPEPEPKPVHQPARSESVPPARPNAPPTTRQASLNTDKSGLDLTTMDKARILAAGRKKKKQASAKNWEDKYAAFNQL